MPDCSAVNRSNTDAVPNVGNVLYAAAGPPVPTVTLYTVSGTTGISTLITLSPAPAPPVPPRKPPVSRPAGEPPPPPTIVNHTALTPAGQGQSPDAINCALRNIENHGVPIRTGRPRTGGIRPSSTSSRTPSRRSRSNTRTIAGTTRTAGTIRGRCPTATPSMSGSWRTPRAAGKRATGTPAGRSCRSHRSATATTGAAEVRNAFRRS